jgi:branched-chain amino acid transport system substrate-binding protein
MQRVFLVIGTAFMCVSAYSADQGITDEVIRVGQVSDLSGATANWGVATTNATRMRIDEVNAAGGIHGRKLEFIVEDGQYQVPVSVKAANKLLNRDKVFVMIGNIGTAMNYENMPRQLRMGVANLFPLTAAASMYEPLHPLKFAYYVSYENQGRGGIHYMVKRHGIKKVCLQTQATDYGHDVESGYNMAVAELGLESVYVGKHKVTETDFVGTVTRLKNTDCELLFMGTITTDTIALYTAARNAGWDKPIMGNMVMLDPLVAAAANGKMEGLYSAGPLVVPDLNEDSDIGQWRRDWTARYEELFGELPNVQSQIGYLTTDLMIKAMEAAGPDLTTEKMLAELEKTRDFVDPFGGPSLSLGPEKHHATDSIFLSQVIDGKWQVVQKNLPY